MAQLGARPNCRSRINTYSEKGNGANQTTPWSIEEGNWFKDESFAGVPMLSPCSPSQQHFPLQLLTGNQDRDTFTFPLFLSTEHKVRSLDMTSTDDLSRYKSHLNCSPEMSAIKIQCCPKQLPRIHMRRLLVRDAVRHSWISLSKGVQLNV